MSPSIVNRFPWYARIFGGRQGARSIHFVLLLSYLAFLIGHVAMVSVTGLAANMNHIVLGIEGGGWRGAALGLCGVASVALACALAHWTAWNHPRAAQYAVRAIHNRVMRRLLFRHLEPRGEYSRKDISPFFWPNGKTPASEEWRALAKSGFRDFRLKVSGLVANPAELSLDDMRALGTKEQITMHHCIQGWSGIAQWGGLPMARLVELVRPAPEAKVCVFRSFGEGLYGGEYYDTQRLENVLHSQCLLAYEMNDQPLGELYGAPLRLRVENQLGYKMVKWIRSVEFVASEEEAGKGHGGKNEDDEYFDLIPDI
jgi:DMSO/TMAO reductase YedYZ molybdopterin-dependent catalytic subunit